MKTPAILNSISVSNNSLPAAKQSGESGSSDVMFNQVLSREVAGRNQAQETNKPAAKENDHSRSDAPKSAAPAAKSEKTVTTDKTKSGEAKKADAEDDDTAAATAASADMLALVANLLQLQSGAGKPVAEAVSGDAAQELGQGQEGKTAITNVTRLLDESVVSDESLPQELDVQASATETAPATDTAQVQAGEHDFAAAVESAVELRAANTAELQTANVAPAAAAPVQANQLQTAASQHVDKLTPRVGSPAWDQALSQKVVWMVAGAQQSASLTLNPPDLGPLQVVLNVNNNQATANFTAAQPEVRQALETAMPKLREMLGEAGIQLGQASVNAGMPNNQQSAFSEQKGSSRGSASQDDQSPDLAVRHGRTQTITAGRGLVDTFV